MYQSQDHRCFISLCGWSACSYFFSPSILIGASHVQLYYKDLVFSCNCCHIWIVTAITHAAPGFSAGINKGSCFRINHFPEDNDYDTDSSEYILRKSLQPPSNTSTLNPSLFSSGGDGPITRVLNMSWHLYPSRIKAWCHDGNWSYRDDEVCCVPMSNRAGLKHDCTHSSVTLYVSVTGVWCPVSHPCCCLYWWISISSWKSSHSSFNFLYFYTHSRVTACLGKQKCHIN